MSLPLHLDFPLPEGRWEVLRERFANEGIMVPDGDAGVVEMSGIRVQFLASNGKLYVTVVKKPFFVTENRVIKELSEFIQAA
jgi:hypothetical protein